MLQARFALRRLPPMDAFPCPFLHTACALKIGAFLRRLRALCRTWRVTQRRSCSTLPEPRVSQHTSPILFQKKSIVGALLGSGTCAPPPINKGITRFLLHVDVSRCASDCVSNPSSSGFSSGDTCVCDEPLNIASLVEKLRLLILRVVTFHTFFDFTIQVNCSDETSNLTTQKRCWQWSRR